MRAGDGASEDGRVVDTTAVRRLTAPYGEVVAVPALQRNLRRIDETELLVEEKQIGTLVLRVDGRTHLDGKLNSALCGDLLLSFCYYNVLVLR